MRKELCFRVENVNGTGMYRVGFHLGNDPFLHPLPGSDQKLAPFFNSLLDNANSYREYYYGFASMEQFRRWVYEDLDVFADRGLMMSIYQTDDYGIGDTQMIFRKSTATLIGRASLI